MVTIVPRESETDYSADEMSMAELKSLVAEFQKNRHLLRVEEKSIKELEKRIRILEASIEEDKKNLVMLDHRFTDHRDNVIKTVKSLDESISSQISEQVIPSIREFAVKVAQRCQRIETKIDANRKSIDDINKKVDYIFRRLRDAESNENKVSGAGGKWWPSKVL